MNSSGKKRTGLFRQLTLLVAFALLLLVGCTQEKQPFKFVQLSDPQLGMGGYEHDKAALRQAVEQVNALDCDFVVVCGDLVHHAADSSFRDFLDIIGECEVPYYFVPGNHDVGKEPTKERLEWYRREIGEDYYSFDHKGFRFVGVNSPLWKSPLEEETGKHDRWFTNLLEESGRHRIVVIGHYPLFIKEPGEEENYSNLSVDKRTALLDLFTTHEVEAYLTGHRHETLLNEYQGIQLVTGETTSKNFDDRPLGFRLWSASPDTLTHRFVELQSFEY